MGKTRVSRPARIDRLTNDLVAPVLGLRGVIFETQAGLATSIGMRIPRTSVSHEVPLKAVTMQRTHRFLMSSSAGPARFSRHNYA